MFGGVRSILFGGTLVKRGKWYCVSFPHKYDSCVESAFKFFSKLRTMYGSGRATGKSAKNASAQPVNMQCL